MKTRLQRALSIVLAALLLLMLTPGALASETEVNVSSETETVIPPTEDDVLAAEDVTSEAVIPGLAYITAFYEDVMAAQSCEAMFFLIANDDHYEVASSLSVKQVYAIRERAQSLEDDGYQGILVETLNELLKYLGEEIDSEYSTELESDIDPGYYNGTIPVYWDTVTALSTGGSSAGGMNVAEVTLGGTTVTWGNANSTSWSGGSTLSSHFPGASANQMTSATMSITAASGYYVTGVVVACAPTGGQSLNPFKCATWKEGNEFLQTFNLTNSTYSDGKYMLSFGINSRYFSHNGKTSPNAYFILIQVAAVPTPLYVEYDYGNVSSFLTVDSNSSFNSPTWTVANGGNNYGNGDMYNNGILTNGTQFAYQYSGSDTSPISSWVHKANSVSETALAEVAAAGYYFAGWSATWYNTCIVNQSTDSRNNHYTMSFSSTYMTGSCKPGDDVQLPTNVRLVAQWEPIRLKVTKTVSGLSDITEYASKTNTYTLQLQNLQNGGYVQLMSKGYAITGDGSLTYTYAAADADVVCPITPGTYKVVETGNYDIKGETVNAYCTTTYPAQTVEVTANGTVQELKVLNTYSSTPAAYDLTIKKTLSGNMYDVSRAFAFTITADKDMTYGGETNASFTFNLKKDEEVTISVPVGATVTVSEDPSGYTYSLGAETTITDHTDLVEGTGIRFTMPDADSIVVFNNDKTATPDTGVLLDSLPYILILAVVVAIGVIVFIRKRRNRDDD